MRQLEVEIYAGAGAGVGDFRKSNAYRRKMGLLRRAEQKLVAFNDALIEAGRPDLASVMVSARVSLASRAAMMQHGKDMKATKRRLTKDAVAQNKRRMRREEKKHSSRSSPRLQRPDSPRAGRGVMSMGDRRNHYCASIHLTVNLL